MHLCECGCGQPTSIAKRTCSSRGVVKGQPFRFVQYHHLQSHNRTQKMRELSRKRATSRDGAKSPLFGKTGKAHPVWKGGKNISSDGYVRLYLPNHPRAGSDGYVLEQRLIMEKLLGRCLAKDEHVHHIDGNCQNNEPANLQLVKPGEHMSIHACGRPRDVLGRFVEATT